MPLFGPPDVERLSAECDVKRLVEALEYAKQASVRRQAAEALGEIGDASAVKPLIGLLVDSDDGVRQTAATALGQIGNLRAVRPLIRALRDRTESVRSAAADALGRIGGLRAVRALTDLVDTDYDMRQQAARALGHAGELAVRPLITALDHWSPSVHDAAATALGQIGAHAVTPLIAALQSTSTQARNGAVDALVQVGETAVESLMDALRGPQATVRQAAASALGQIGDRRAVAPLTAVLRDPEVAVRHVAAEALDRIGWEPDRSRAAADYWLAKGSLDACAEIGEPAVAPLAELLGDPQGFERRSIVEVLGRIGGPRAVEQLVGALTDPDATVRRTAAEALGRIGDPRMARTLVPLLRDEDRPVRQAAADSLDALWWRPSPPEDAAGYWIAKEEWNRCIEIGEPAIGPLTTALGCPQVPVRRAVVEALGRLGHPRAVEALAVGLGDRDAGVRQATVEVLRQIGDPGSAALLVASLQDEDHSVRRAGAWTLDALGWEPHSPQDAAIYWIAKERWQKCVEMGEPAVEPLIAMLNDAQPFVVRAIVEVLGQIGDSRAVEALIGVLESKEMDASVRREAARSLVRLYHSGGIGRELRQSILMRRECIRGAPHTDHLDWAIIPFHDHRPEHTDRGGGFGVDFQI